jgi:DNA polymerase-3 subunit gamma/tau
MTDSLLTKYRPKTLKEVVGQDAAVRSLGAALQRKAGKAFLFVGPTGVGKTTLARISATMLGCKPIDLIEIDAATDTGIDDMRAVTSNLMYRPLGDGAVKALIVDECHALSRQAFTSLLKSLEEPPQWVYWFLCTTEGGKVPANIVTRCLRFDLKPVGTNTLYTLLEDVLEDMGTDLSDEVFRLVVKEARGSPRQMLANLAVCLNAKDRAEAAELLRSAEGSTAVVELARALFQGAPWVKLQEIVGGLGDVNPESVRQVVRAYGTKLVLGAKTNDQAGLALEVLDAFSEPFYSGDGLTPVLIACAHVTLGK